jgi:long-chain fatty acid transport protein
MKSLSIRVLVLAVLVLGVASAAWAQTDEEHFATFPFNFSNPGARAAGMGGAFIGIANDASSAISNPAGLTNLLRKQIYIEGKGISTPFAHLSFNDSIITGYGEIAQKTTGGITFLNMTMPWKHNLSFGFSYNQFLQYSDKFTYSPRRIVSYSQTLLPGVNSDFTYTGRTFSGTVGYKAAENLRIGGSVSINRVVGNLTAARTPVTTGGVTINYQNSSMDSSDWALGYNVGVLYEPVADTLFLGLTYNDIANATLSESTGSASRDVNFNTPRRLGFGASWKTMAKRVVVAFDAIHVYYSDLAKDTTIVLYNDMAGIQTAIGPSPVQFAPITNTGAGTSSRFSIDNGTEYRGGVEVKLIEGPKPLFFRYGIFRLPVHNLRYPVGGNNLGGIQVDASGGKHGENVYYPDQVIEQVLWVTERAVLGNRVLGANGVYELDTSKPTYYLGNPDIGWSLGGGWIVGNYQFDIAYTRSAYQRSEFIASAAIRFGK